MQPDLGGSRDAPSPWVAEVRRKERDEAVERTRRTRRLGSLKRLGRLRRWCRRMGISRVSVLAGLGMSLSGAALLWFVFGRDYMPSVGYVPDEYTGFYSQGFEGSGFTPCGTRGGSVTGKGTVRLAAFHQAHGVEEYHSVFARVRATRRGPGRFGHLGASEYEFDIQRVLEVRLMTKADCKCSRSRLYGCE